MLYSSVSIDSFYSADKGFLLNLREINQLKKIKITITSYHWSFFFPNTRLPAIPNFISQKDRHQSQIREYTFFY